jgi:hypothetical protein
MEDTIMLSLKSTVIILSLGLISVSSANAIDTKTNKLSPAQLSPTKLNAAAYLTAKLQQAVKKNSRIKLAGIQWSCRAKQCRAKSSWPKSPLQACKLLVAKTQRVKSFSLARKSLNKSQINQCNQVVKKQAKASLLTNKKFIPKGIGTSPAKLPSSQPAKRPVQMPASPSLAVKGAPVGVASRQNNAILPSGAGRGVPTPGFRGDDGRPSNQDAAQAIREAAAARSTQGRIESVVPTETANACILPTNSRPGQFIISGSRFGTNAAGRKIVLATASRNTVVAEASIVSWSDTRIVAHISSRERNIPRARRYVVAMKDARNQWASNLTKRIYVCPDKVTIQGKVTLDHCSAGLSNVKIGLSVDGVARRDLAVTAVPGDSFAMQYKISLPASANMDIVASPKLVGVSCPGGSWTPLNKRFSLGFRRYRATQDFDYHVGLQRLSLPMNAIARIVQDQFVGMEMRMNNYDPVTRNRKSNDTRLKMPPALGGEERIYDIPPVAQDPRTYYVHDINLNNISVRATSTGLKLTMAFETAGTEFIGFCRPSNAGEELSCLVGAPDVQARLSVDVFLELERYYSHGAPVSISFGSVRVVANLNAQAGGICKAIDVCNLFSNYKRQIKRAIEVNLMSSLDTTAVRDQVANALLPSLRGFRIGRVNSARVEGGNFVIRYIPAE